MAVDQDPQRIRRRRAVRQEQILAVAARAFATRGAQSVTLDEIAEAVDVAKGTLYSHFPTKSALLAAIVHPALVALELALRTIEATDAEAVVSALLRQWAKLVREHHDAMHVAHGLDAELPDSVVAIHGRVVHQVHRLLAQRAVAARLRGSPQWAAMLIARLGLPLFDSFECLDATGEAFVEAVSQLVLCRGNDTRENAVVDVTELHYGRRFAGENRS